MRCLSTIGLSFLAGLPIAHAQPEREQSYSWRTFFQPGGPPPGVVAGTFDPLTGQTIVVSTDPGRPGETWAWDGTEWTQLSGNEPFQNYVSMTVDHSRREPILTDAIGLVWGWNGAAWTQLSSEWPGWMPTTTLVYDPIREQAVTVGVCFFTLCVLHGFVVDNPMEWHDGLPGWERVPNAGIRNNHVSLCAATYDSERGVVLSFGGIEVTPKSSNRSGSLFAWDGLGWSLLAAAGPSPRVGATMTFDESRRQAVLFGGIVDAPGSWPPFASSNDLWRWDGAEWNEITPIGTAIPRKRNKAVFVYDSRRDVFVMFGGHDGSNALGDTWELVPTCYADCDPNGVLDIFDFLCFQSSFVAGEPYACDCDPDPACDIFDFLCFQNAFVIGCP